MNNVKNVYLYVVRSCGQTITSSTDFLIAKSLLSLQTLRGEEAILLKLAGLQFEICACLTAFHSIPMHESC